MRDLVLPSSLMALSRRMPQSHHRYPRHLWIEVQIWKQGRARMRCVRERVARACLNVHFLRNVRHCTQQRKYECNNGYPTSHSLGFILVQSVRFLFRLCSICPNNLVWMTTSFIHPDGAPLMKERGSIIGYLQYQHISS